MSSAVTLSNVSLLSCVRRIGDWAREVPVTVALTFFALAASAGPDVAECLAFDRGAIASGQVFRTLTGHFTHWTFEHTVWDVAVFVVLGAWCERRNRTTFLFTLLLGIGLIDAGVWLLRPDLAAYRGLSGLDSALFVLAAAHYAADARRTADRSGMLVAAGAVALFVGKTLYETLAGRTIFVDSTSSGFEPLVLAHLLGAAAAAVVATGAIAIRRKS
ncbi:MAG: rhombosortase [Pirellulales bacterium]